MLIGAIDIGGTKTVVGCVDSSGQIFTERGFKTEGADVYAHLAKCADVYKECASECAAKGFGQAAGVGVALPGMVDKAREKLDNAVFSGWRDVWARELFQQLLGIDKVYIENDVNACAIGELRFGAGKRRVNTGIAGRGPGPGYDDFIWATVSTGVGGAIVSGGKLVEGRDNFAGELGHVKVEYDAPELCPCGQYGCLEAHGSGSAITRETARLARNRPEFAALLAARGLAPDSIGCAALARAGSPEAIAIFRRAGVYLGRGFAYAVNLLNPQAVIIGGGVADSFELIEGAIKDTLKTCADAPLAGVDIVKTALGYRAALLGAAALALNNI